MPSNIPTAEWEIITWKNLSQNSLADALIGNYKAPEVLDDVDALIDWAEQESRLV